MKLNHFVVLGFVSLILAACGGSSGSNQTASATSDSASGSVKVLKVGTDASFAPFESMNEKQEIYGFDIDLLNEMAKVGGFKLEFKHTPWDGIFASLNNRDVDIVASAVTITDERKNTMDFTDSYYKITQVVMVSPNKDVKTVEDLTKLTRVGVVAGQTGDFAAQKIFGATSNQIARFDSLPLLIKEVENSGLDAAISDSAVIAHHIKNNAGKGFTMVSIPDFEEENYGFAVRKGDTETLNLLNQSLKTVRENGTYAEIEKKYFAQ
ncbi:basic amino acid ABC transporter substrate-binding protein [Wielerella bovis]|uniref:basic amino acid ABC transporter substrate-binding protein n=1 Tax=Wielerella bovis TaxID=2917790 RepID=UPI002019E595|nr:basic amino acid ABC transporter substrate-binding protein [Wielerella bovis]MCG7656649.1 basic amino acid ABC transporter substrate-binding protein [Wielerella bovis]MCG7658874.1 basic amino acid ABC transporter substrate-binding protein [Wielerella bovis]ULJ65363.1 basic amino acid ABC transporter substrate-binding protein [Wielerella bovis]ULJ67710.1 basic amino acid ABC transporter substrate-binding protein [Wielerella bovis]